MGKKNSFTGNVTLTADQCDTLKRYATNGIIFNAENERLKEKLASAVKSASIWKQRHDELNEKYKELKEKAQPIWMRWKSQQNGSGLFFLPSSPEERKLVNTRLLPASTDGIWKYKKGIICAYDESEPAGNDPAYRP